MFYKICFFILALVFSFEVFYGLAKVSLWVGNTAFKFFLTM